VDLGGACAVDPRREQIGNTLMTTTTAAGGQFEFRAETQQLLHLMIHALYTNKEIFLRELISNASDALDRLRYESMLETALSEGSAPPVIRLEAEPGARTLTIHDTGIGMSMQETIDHLGTIARSGSQELLTQAARGGASVPELIGRFGVGFYSAFMVADRVSVLTRRAGEQQATLWESAGDGHFAVSEAAKPEHGTSITLHLKPVSEDAGIEDYTDRWVLTRIVKRYSDFVSHPIVLVAPPAPDLMPSDAEPAPAASQAPVETPLNTRTPIWVRSDAEVGEDEYTDFYKLIAKDWHPPLLRLRARAEGRWEYQALLFVPAEAPHDLFYHGASYGLQLYARRVLVMEECRDLLPRYLRFVKGVVDTLDLPLNISRQMLQEHRHIADIRKHLTRKLLDRFAELFAADRAAYDRFWAQFGRVLKEGVGQDHDQRERLLGLLLFESSHDPVKLTTLREYLERMPPDQQEIYFLTGESRAALEHAPHAEAVRARGHEILYLTHPVDELVMDVLPQYEGRKVRSLGKGSLTGPHTEPPSPLDDSGEFAALIARLQTHFDAYVKQVRLSTRLTASPACLVTEDYDYSPFMERLLLKGKGGGPRQRRILELNPAHPIVIALRDGLRASETPAAGLSWETSAELLFGYAALSEGSELPEPVAFTRGLLQMLDMALAGAREEDVDELGR
jgi:molecular chaperone HtpG